MKIAIHNAFAGEKFAETELSRRICLAANNIGWEAVEVNSAVEINNVEPDFVLVTHFNTPKLSRFPTYGCMWNPPCFFDQYAQFISKYGDEYKQQKMPYHNIFSYDGYLSSSSVIDQWLIDQLGKTGKKFFIAPFFTSCNQTAYLQPNLHDPRLVYVGSNWDGKRFKQLFKRLDAQDFMQVYGSNWDYLKHSYKGALPFDGVSVLNTLNRAGVGLCLHRPEHSEAETPSMRIFEIVASGAIAICGEHKFIREAFGDSVLYIDIDASVMEQVQQISDHMNWIKNNPQLALEMSQQAHSIFTQKYSLEKLLLDILPHHQELIKNKGFIKIDLPQFDQPQVQFIVRVGDRPLSMLKRCLDSIARQTYGNIGVILVKYQAIQELTELINSYQDMIHIIIIESESTGFRSTQIKDGIRAVSAPYFGILDDDNIFHPNHTYTLRSLLEKMPEIGVAYSGAIKTTEDFDNSEIINKELAYFHDFNLKKIARFQNFIPSNSFIARSSLITDIYQADPQLQTAADFYLILELCRKSIFLFSYEVTSEFYWCSTLKHNVNLTQLDHSNRLWTSFKDHRFLYIEEFDLNQKPVIKYSKLVELRYSKTEQILGANQRKFSIYQLPKQIYLKLSGGGKFNKKPNIIAKWLVSLKQFLLE